jgi:ABC-type nitrate/sulfonate/bicarbonate transport system ATPase subunit
VSCRVEEGEFVSVIGASGCGKSTLLQLLDGALRPGHGDITVGGHAATVRDNTRAVVYQNFALLPWKTVLRNVRLGLDYRRRDLPLSERDRLARHYLDRVGLSACASLYPYQLSGGMQQRVGLARAFAVRPALLLMDEPFGALDAQNAEILREEVRALVAEERRSVVFVTHNLDEALQLSDRVLLMSSSPGRIVEDISLVEPKSDETAWHREHYGAYRARLWDFLKSQVAMGQVRAVEVEA